MEDSAGSLMLGIRRQDEGLDVALALSGDWKFHDMSWRTSLFAMPPRLGLWAEEASGSKRKAAGIAKDALAVEVMGLFKPEVKASGLKEDDLIVEIGGRRDRMDEREFHLFIRQNYHAKGAVMPLVVKRDGKEKRIEVRF